MKKYRVVFMGTPEFAVCSLDAIITRGYEVAAIVTSVDKPAGRGRNTRESAVKKFAKSAGLRVLQPRNLKDPSFIDKLTELEADVFIVVAFRMLPEEVWKIPPSGTINLHASLLPQYRGAAPVNHVLINGEKVTGVTTFLIDDEIDTGKILLRREVPVTESENAGSLHDKLMIAGAELIINTLEGLEKGLVSPKSQAEFMTEGETLKTAPKLTPDFCTIDWNNDPGTLHNFIRGLSPYPGARTSFRNDEKTISFKIYESLPGFESHDRDPGEIITDGKKILRIACKGGFLNILSLQVEGKRRLGTEEFLNGFRIKDYPLPLS